MKSGLALLILFTSVLCACHSMHAENNGDEATAYFWSGSAADTSHVLFINDVMKGKLPYHAGSGQPGAANNDALKIPIRPGSYQLKVKGTGDTVIAEGTLFISLGKGHTEIRSSWTGKGYETLVVIGK